MSNIKLFENPEFGQVRVLIQEDGEPLFCLADICNILELQSSAVIRRLEEGVTSNHPPPSYKWWYLATYVCKRRRSLRHRTLKSVIESKISKSIKLN